MKQFEEINFGYELYKKIRVNPQEFFKSLTSIADIVKLNTGVKSIYVLNNPEYIQQVQDNSFGSYKYDTFTTRFIKKLAGLSLIALEGDVWKKRHKVMRPSFSRSDMEKKFKLMLDTVGKSLDGRLWNEHANQNEYVNLNHLISYTSIVLTSSVLFSTHKLPSLAYNSDEVIESTSYQLGQLASTVVTRIFSVFFLPIWVPTKTNRMVNRIKKTQYALCREILNKRKELVEQPDDVLAKLLEQQAKTPEAISDKTIIQEMVSLYFASPTNLNFIISWMFYHLAQEKEIFETLRDEIDQKLGDTSPKVEDVYQLPFLMACIKETIRLQPPGWVLPRETLEEVSMGETVIPKNKSVYVVPIAIHTDKNYWEDPERFNPNRFLNGSPIQRSTYMPFGIGHKKCVGDNFSMVALPLIAIEIIKRYDLEIQENYTPPMIAKISLRFNGGFPFKLTRRKKTESTPLVSTAG